MNDFYCLYRKAGFFRKSLADYIGVTERTIKSWELKNNPPLAVVKLIQLLSDDLSHLGADWTGFHFSDSELYSPEGEVLRPGQIRAHKYLKMTIGFRDKENAKLKQEVERLRSPNHMFSLRKSLP